MKDLAREFKVSQNRIVGLFGLSKGTLYYQAKGYPASRKSTRTRIASQVAAVKAICRERPTYGIPRVKKIAERDFSEKMSYHMTYAIMRENQLVIQKSAPNQSRREHTGKIAVEQPNTRWSSDITSIQLWNGTKAKFTYVLDCCDRTLISWRLGKHIQACDIEQMLQEAIFKRFPTPETKALGLEFLHDNGPEYIEKKFRKQMIVWDVEDCHTPTYSPQSNGISEAFNGTFKRDYVYQGFLDDIETLKAQIGKWVEDYNTFAPHSALNMNTPEEFFKLKIAA